MDLPTDRPPSVASAARHVIFGFGVREIGLGALGLALLVVTGVWWRGRSVAEEREWKSVRTELAMHADAAEYYRDRFSALQANAAEIRRWAAAHTTEPLRTWARERSRRFDAFVGQLDREVERHAYEAAAQKIKELSSGGDVAGAHAALAQLPLISFPSPRELTQLRHDAFEAPLAEYSRQNPAYYGAFRQYEAEAAKQDEQALRAEITSAGEAVTPQLMLKVELLATVAAPDDPVVANWSAVASALDYFEQPDAETLGRWARAQQALKLKEYQTAAAEMQSILNSKVRTRQPFRAAFGRALLKSRPDVPSDAFPYLVEAAAAGDKQARTWVAQQEMKRANYVQAQRWLEAATADGDREAVPMLLDLYADHASAIQTDAAHTAGVLERVTDLPDAPAASWLMLGRTYEAADPTDNGRARAFACYQRAADKGSVPANLEVARCALDATGVPENVELARDAAARAFAGGEREAAAALFIRMMERSPDRVAGAVEKLFEQEQVAKGGGYGETRVYEGPSVTQLRAQIARYLEQTGSFGQAARVYAGMADAASARRHAELTASHPCETCGGLGKVKQSVPCPTCGGKGKQLCGFCGGSGYIFVPGTPPCTTCGGSGTMVQDHRSVACAACGGTGKGKGNVIKHDCTHCEHGYIRCSDCVGGVQSILKECPDCHGRGQWSWAEKSGRATTQ